MFLVLIGLSICSYAFSDDGEVQSSYGSSVEIMALYSMPEYLGGEFRASSTPHFSLSAGVAFPIQWQKSYLSWALLDFFFDKRNQHEYVGLGILATWADDLNDEGIFARVGYTFDLFETVVIDIAYYINISHALFDIPIKYLVHTTDGVKIQNYQGSLKVAVGLRL